MPSPVGNGTGNNLSSDGSAPVGVGARRRVPDGARNFHIQAAQPGRQTGNGPGHDLHLRHRRPGPRRDVGHRGGRVQRLHGGEARGVPARGFDSAVLVEWETASELDNLGFHLYRGLSPDGPWDAAERDAHPRARLLAGGQALQLPRLRPAQRGDVLLPPRGRRPARPRDVARARLRDAARRSPAGRRATAKAAVAVARAAAARGASSPEDDAQASWKPHGDPADVSLRVVERSRLRRDLRARDGRLLLPGAGRRHVEALRPRLLRPRRARASHAAHPPHLEGRRRRPRRARRLRHARGPPLLRRPPCPLAGEPEAVSTARRHLRGLASRSPGEALTARRRTPPRPGPLPRAQARVLQTAFQGDAKKAYVELSPLRLDETRGRLVLARRLLVTVVFDGVVDGETGIGSLGRRAPVPVASDSAPTRRRLLARFVTRSRGLHAVSWEDLLAATPRASPARLLASCSSLAPLAAGRLRPLPRRAPIRPLRPRVHPLLPLRGHRRRLRQRRRLRARRRLRRPAHGPSASPPRRSRHHPTPLASLFATRSFETNVNYLPALLEARDLWLWDCGPRRRPGPDYPFSLAPVARPRDRAAHRRPPGRQRHHRRPRPPRPRLRSTDPSSPRLRFDGMKPVTLEADVPTSLLRRGREHPPPRERRRHRLLRLFRLPRPLLPRLPPRPRRRGRRPRGQAPRRRPRPGLEASPPAPSSSTSPAASPAGSVALSPGGASPSPPRRITATSPSPPRPSSAPRSAPSAVLAPRHHEPGRLDPHRPRGAPPRRRAPRRSTAQAQGLAAMAVSLEDVYDDFGFGEVSPTPSATSSPSPTTTGPRPRPATSSSSVTPPTTPRASSPEPPAPTSSPRPSPSPPSSGPPPTPSTPPSTATTSSPTSPSDASPPTPSPRPRPPSRRSSTSRTPASPSPARPSSSPTTPTSPATSRPTRRHRLPPPLAARPEALPHPARTTATKAAVLSAFDSGASLVSYVGHGSPGLWASESILRSPDVAALAPQPQQPLVLTMTCSNGYFVSPYDNSLAERPRPRPEQGRHRRLLPLRPLPRRRRSPLPPRPRLPARDRSPPPPRRPRPRRPGRLRRLRRLPRAPRLLPPLRRPGAQGPVAG